MGMNDCFERSEVQGQTLISNSPLNQTITPSLRVQSRTVPLLKITQIKTQRLFVYDLLQQGSQSPSPCIWQSLRVQQNIEKDWWYKKDIKSVMLWWEIVGMGKLEVGQLEEGHLMWLVWGACLLFFGWSCVRKGDKKASSHWPSPHCSRWVAAEVFPG